MLISNVLLYFCPILRRKSNAPVWSDTLLPVDQCQAGPSRHETMIDDTIPKKEPKIVKHGEISGSSTLKSSVESTPQFNSLTDELAEQLEDMAVEFLKRSGWPYRHFF